MEAFILVIDLVVMLYLCWRIFVGRDDHDIDLGYLRYDKTNQSH